MASEEGLLAHGAHCTGAVERGIANSLGIDAHCIHSGVTLNTTMTGQSGSGYSRFASRNIEEMDIQAIGREAVEMCLANRGARPIEPGNYEVVLNPYAVNDLLISMASIGLNALALQEQRSFMCNQLGKQLLGENVTIWDDGLDTRGFNTPFDFEGVPKRKVIFFQDGVAKGVTHDSLTASKEGIESTGHRSPPPGSKGPIPTNLFMRGGDSSIEGMIRSTERGIYIHRFHYVNVVEPRSAVITGMTRDGTFLIEGGKMTKPLKNLRFTQSILDALSLISLISKETKLVAPEAEYEIPFLTGSVVPALKIENFHFSGVSEAGSSR
jgi:PmbA protein